MREMFWRRIVSKRLELPVFGVLLVVSMVIGSVVLVSGDTSMVTDNEQVVIYSNHVEFQDYEIKVLMVNVSRYFSMSNEKDVSEGAFVLSVLNCTSTDFHVFIYDQEFHEIPSSLDAAIHEITVEYYAAAIYMPQFYNDSVSFSYPFNGGYPQDRDDPNVFNLAIYYNNTGPASMDILGYKGTIISWHENGDGQVEESLLALPSVLMPLFVLMVLAVLPLRKRG